MSEQKAESGIGRALTLSAGGLVVALLAWSAFGPPGTVACAAVTGYDEFIVVPVERCPATAQRLGTPVRLSVVGTGCANYESGGDSGGPGTAWGTVPISGPLGGASFDFRANKSGDTWLVGRGLVTFGDGTKTDVVACVGPEGLADVSNRAMRSILASGCDGDDASQCQILGETLRDGRFGPADPAGARVAFDRACRLGSQPACAARDAIRLP